MEIPKSFKPEKNLDNNTQRLLEEEIKPKQKLMVGKAELEEILEELKDSKSFYTYHKSNKLHSKIEKLVEKSDYKSIKGLRYKYWSKPNLPGQSKVLIRISNEQERDYAFAIVEDDKLDAFCKRFEKYKTGVLRHSKKHVSYSLGNFFKGSLTGLLTHSIVLGFLTYKSRVPPELYASTVLIWTLGAGLGLDSYMHKRNEKKMEKCHSKLILDEKEAVKAAFS